MKRITTKQKELLVKHTGIVNLYISGKYTTERIAQLYGVSVREVQRIATKYKVIRTIAESNKLMAPLKRYRTIPPELKAKRKQLSSKQRFIALSAHPYCGHCGRRPDDGVRLEVDHIDENPMNNEPDNLQVLCGPCNTGKSHVARFS